ncbi:unnamed protein product [Ixodes persulcatus]
MGTTKTCRSHLQRITEMDEGNIRLVKVPISLATILEYVGDSKRCLIEGEDVLNCEHVIECSVAPGPALGVLRVVGYVLQSSALNGEPHTVNLYLNHGEVLSISCSCVAGNSSRCKHCVAVLLKANRMRELPQLSTTDLPQAWGQHAKEVVKVKYASTTLKKVPFCPKFQRPALPPVEPGILGRLKKDLPYVCPIAIHERKRPHAGKICGASCSSVVASRPRSLLKVLRRMPEEELQNVLTVLKRVLTKDVIAEIERRTKAQAAEPEWMLYRKGMATASICHSFRTWAESVKKPAIHPRPHNVGGLLNQVLRLNTFQSASMKRGQENEGTAKLKYLNVLTKDGHCARIDNMGFMVREEIPFLGCSPDGIVTYICQCCPGRRNLLEVKCPNVVSNSFR